MKTIQELYQEVLGSEELKQEFLSLKPGEIEGFAASHGCEATLDDIKAFFESKKESGALSDAELEQIAGGKSSDLAEAGWSCSTYGFGCLYSVIKSLVTGEVGTAIEGEGMLCSNFTL